jgi:hypothetical protein
MRMGSNVSLIAMRLLSVGFPSKGGKASRASLKRSVIALGSCLLRRIFGNWEGSIEDHYDYNQHKGIGSGKVGGLGAFGDMAEFVRGYDGNGGLRGFFRIKLKLDFHCRRCWGTNERII